MTKYSYIVFCYLLSACQIYQSQHIPEEWIKKLNIPEGTGDYRIIKLTIDILNIAPIFN